MALAGRPAKRLGEATRRPAMTIAKFLLAVRTGDLVLPGPTLVVINESSMVERLSLAYAISAHKSQGSRFKRVAIVSTASKIYDHALVYTALTRAVEQAVFVGERTAFESAVQNPPAAQRRQVGFRPKAQRVRDAEVSLL